MRTSSFNGHITTFLMAALSCFITSCQITPSSCSSPMLPQNLAANIPAGCQQIIAVSADSITSTQGHLWLLESPPQQPSAPSIWNVTLGPLPVTLGRNGLASAHGAPPLSPTFTTQRLKREGDQCAPIGVFVIPFAFGSHPTADIRMPYHHMTPHHAGVDDPASRYYNQIVDTRKVTPDWHSAESMLPSGGSYELGLFVDHNPHRTPGAGSCIFLHLWLKPGEPTSGCTAMSKATMQLLLKHLRPEAHPHLVQWADQP